MLLARTKGAFEARSSNGEVPKPLRRDQCAGARCLAKIVADLPAIHPVPSRRSFSSPSTALRCAPRWMLLPNGESLASRAAASVCSSSPFGPITLGGMEGSESLNPECSHKGDELSRRLGTFNSFRRPGRETHHALLGSRSGCGKVAGRTERQKRTGVDLDWGEGQLQARRRLASADERRAAWDGRPAEDTFGAFGMREEERMDFLKIQASPNLVRLSTAGSKLDGHRN